MKHLKDVKQVRTPREKAKALALESREGGSVALCGFAHATSRVQI